VIGGPKNEIVFNSNRYRLAYTAIVGMHDGIDTNCLLSVSHLRSISVEQSMRSTLLTAVVLGGALVSAAVNAGPLPASTTTVPDGAPIGHLQPRAQQFIPGSTADQTEQQKQSVYDAEQQKLDKQLDKSLNICRC
jgi:hypothetical protein